MSDENVRVETGEVSVSQQLLNEGKIEFTDLDGKKATLDERVADELGVAYGMTPRYRWPEPVEPKPPTWWQRRRIRLADRFRSLANRIWYVDQHAECD